MFGVISVILYTYLKLSSRSLFSSRFSFGTSRSGLRALVVVDGAVVERSSSSNRSSEKSNGGGFLNMGTALPEVGSMLLNENKHRKIHTTDSILNGTLNTKNW